MAATLNRLLSAHEGFPNHHLLITAIIFGFVWLVHCLGETRNLKHIPTLGFDWPILYYLDTLRYFSNGKTYVDETVAKFPNQVIKIPDFLHWKVVLSGSDAIEELRSAPEDALSLSDAQDEFLQTVYTLGPGFSEAPHHVSIVRSQLTRALPKFVPEVHDEIVSAFDELIISPNDHGWKSFTALKTMTEVVCRASNRVFVGLPLCRNPEYLKLSIQFTTEILAMTTFLQLVPRLLRPGNRVVNRFYSRLPGRFQQGVKHLKPIVDARREEQEKVGDGYEKPLDFLSWLMDEAKDEEQTIESLTRRVLVVNFAAIHSSSNVSYSRSTPLRLLAACWGLHSQVEEVIKREGWSKEGLDQMHKVDSFTKESQRMNPIGNLLMGRVARKDYTFADGTFVPKGTTVCVNCTPAHNDPEKYDNPDRFDGFRFAKMRLLQDGRKYDIVTTSPEFGHRRHACPGRFFAACELKIMLAHTVLNYDVKMENEGVRPPDLWFASACIVPNRKAKVMFRRHASIHEVRWNTGLPKPDLSTTSV